MTETLSIHDARRISLASQNLISRTSFGRGEGATLKAIEHLGYVQIDTLSVVARAHLHTLWNRVAGFQAARLARLQAQGRVFEHWAHALAILPMRDFRFSLPMMHRIADGDIHWHPKDRKETSKVLKRIREEGPLTAKDFKDKKSSDAMWARSPSKLALEQLFMEGQLMIPHRLNFHKVYDLRDRVLPANIDTSMPSADELCRHLISSYLRANGIGQIREMHYLRKGLGAQMSKTMANMTEQGLVTQIEISGRHYYCETNTLQSSAWSKSRPKLKILSPFDNAVIQRRRLSELFDFDYQIECYLPKAKRKFGYFCLPVLRGNRFVARLDAKADRKKGVFHLLHLHLESSLKNSDSFQAELRSELKKFAAFDGCNETKIHRISPFCAR